MEGVVFYARTYDIQTATRVFSKKNTVLSNPGGYYKRLSFLRVISLIIVTFNRAYKFKNHINAETRNRKKFS